MLIFKRLFSYLTKPAVYNCFIDYQVDVFSVTSYGPIVIINDTKILIKTHQSFNVGDVLKISGQVINFNNETLLFSKDYFMLQTININYLHSLNVENIFLQANVTLIKEHHSLYILFKNYLQSYPLLLWFLLGVKLKKYDFLYKSIMKLHVAHVFVVSGFHVTLIKKMMYKVMKYLRINNFLPWLLMLIIVWFWCYVLNFNASILRASLLVTLQTINNFFGRRKWHVINLWCVIFLLMFLLWSYQIWALNFILTFVSSLTIYLTNAFIKQKYPLRKRNRTLKRNFRSFNYLWKSCLPLINVYLISWPIIIFVNGNCNLSGFFINLFLSPLIIVWQFLSIPFLWCPFIVNFLTNVLWNWCQFCDVFSLVINFKNFHVDNLLFIYLGILNLIIFYEPFLHY